MSYHGIPGFRTARGAADAHAFDAWLADTVALPARARDAALRHSQEVPAARAAHPHAAHPRPLMVAAGAAGDDQGHVPCRDEVLGTTVSAVPCGSRRVRDMP